MTNMTAQRPMATRPRGAVDTAAFARLSDLSFSEWCYLSALTGFLSQGVLNTAASMIGSLVPFVTQDWVTPLAIHLPLALYVFGRIQARQPLRVVPFLFLYGALLAVMVATVITHPEYVPTMFDADWNGSLLKTLLSPTSAVVAFLVVLLAPSGNLILQSLIWASYLTFLGNIVRYSSATARGYWEVADSQGNSYAAAYDLGFGYSVLLSTVVFAFLAFCGKRPLLHGGGVAAGLVMIVTGGSRAPLAVVVLALLLLVLYFRRTLLFGSRWRVAGLAFITAGALVLIANLNRLLLAIQAWLVSRGSSARSIDRLLDGSFTEDNARDNLGNISARLIEAGGPFGLGLYGDRHHIRSQYHWGYPHNLLDELWVTYGWLGGTLLIIAGVAAFVFAYMRVRNTLHGALLVLTLPMIFQLWVSMSYLLSVWFWVLLALVWRCLTLPREELGDAVPGRGLDEVGQAGGSRVTARGVTPSTVQV